MTQAPFPYFGGKASVADANGDKSIRGIAMITDATFMRGSIVDEAITRLRGYEDLALALSPDGYFLAFSGGKDSIVLHDLAVRSGVKFTAHFQWTTIDPPEVLRFIRANYPQVIWSRPAKSMFQLISSWGPPTMWARWCCSELKEGAGIGRMVTMGLRWEESPKRGKRRMYESCMRSGRRLFLNPIIDWTTEDVWAYIRARTLAYPCLYDEGFKRVGCVMCPLKSRRERERDAARWPAFNRMYLLAFQQLLDSGKRDEMDWKTPADVMEWWLQDPPDKGEDTETQSLFGEEA